jgi:Kdo2-lipid IVA lauroyltransferase/acyltransferase
MKSRYIPNLPRPVMDLRSKLLLPWLWLAIIGFGILPRRWCLGIGRMLGRLGFVLFADRAKVALENLEMIYGQELSTTARARLARENFAHLGAVITEVLHFLLSPSQSRLKFIEIQGEEHLFTALSQGKGVILFSAHMGNFVLMTSALSHLTDLSTLFRDPPEPVASQLYAWMRHWAGIGSIKDNPRRRSAFECGQFIKAGKALVMMTDQVENGGVFVNFMGRPAGSSIGAARLAQITGAPLLPVHCHRRPQDLKLEIVIEPEYILRPEDKLEKAIPRVVEGLNAVVEKWVRAYPEQWLWGHRRWRTWRK